MGFRIIDASTHETLDGLPSPFLIEQGGGEAYPVSLSAESERPYWYAKAPGYASSDGKYTRVRILHTEDFRVDVHIRVVDASADEFDPDVRDAMEWDDYFIVEAASDQEAESLAREKAVEEAERQWGGNPEGFVIDIIRTRRGVSI